MSSLCDAGALILTPKLLVNMGCTSLCDAALASWKLSYSRVSPEQLTDS